jgi:hypothetical protein
LTRFNGQHKSGLKTYDNNIDLSIQLKMRIFSPPPPPFFGVGGSVPLVNRLMNVCTAFDNKIF